MKSVVKYALKLLGSKSNLEKAIQDQYRIVNPIKTLEKILSQNCFNRNLET